MGRRARLQRANTSMSRTVPARWSLQGAKAGRDASPCPAHAGVPATDVRTPRASGLRARYFKDLRKWSEREDLNLRPLVPQTSALTGLRYAPTWGEALEHRSGEDKGKSPHPPLLPASSPETRASWIHPRRRYPMPRHERSSVCSAKSTRGPRHRPPVGDYLSSASLSIPQRNCLFCAADSGHCGPIARSIGGGLQ